ncbi:hypothetical protein EW026_g7011 [Hermanssonia centrifuga]|uniref:Uncharacterized protein n=1 Tax=Hermanssonia centrifuga TaxID=98765 RepID=A0A4S4KAY1_9APHY|nr:hypothetical protein EW026_g7011 [Hermanssonia centrifuga]
MSQGSFDATVIAYQAECLHDRQYNSIQIRNKRPSSLSVQYLAHIVATLTVFQPAPFSIASIQELLALYFILNRYGIVTIGTRIPVIIADILVLALTWRKTFRHRMEAIRVGVQTPLSALLLRDGTVYFFALLAMNIAVVLVNTVPSLQTASPVSDTIPVYVSVFVEYTTTLITIQTD